MGQEEKGQGTNGLNSIPSQKLHVAQYEFQRQYSKEQWLLLCVTLRLSLPCMHGKGAACMPSPVPPQKEEDCSLCPHDLG